MTTEVATVVVLCTECENCPEVELTPSAVKIGEEGNLALLKHKEWDLLVDPRPVRRAP